MDVIDFESEQRKRDTNSRLQWVDESGVRWFKFSAEYQFDGKTYAFDYWATSQDEALARPEVLKQSAEYTGQICDEIPA